jgi:hypothetical protein
MDVKQFIVDRLKELLPEYDIRTGTLIYDWFANLHYLMLLPFQESLEYIYQGSYLANYNLMSEEQMDLLASNYLVTRVTGSKATGTITLYFVEAQSVQITIATKFINSGGLIFYSTAPVSATKESLAANYDVTKSLYYLSFPVIAELEGVQYQIEPNSITSIEDGPEGVYIIENTSFIDGADRETNTELYNRIKLSLGLKNLVTKESIYATLTELYTNIDRIYAIGHGESEMRRDLVNGIHVGNMVDIYVKPVTLSSGTSDIILTYDEYQSFIDGGLSEGGKKYPTIYFERYKTNVSIPTITDVPVIPPLSAYLILGSYTQALDMNPGFGEGAYGDGGYNWGTDWDALIISYTPATRYSSSELAKLVFNPVTVPKYSTVRIAYNYANTVTEIGDYLNEDSVRVITCSHMVKHFVPIYTDVTFAGTNGTEYSDTGLVSDVTHYIEEAYGDSGIEVSDLVKLGYDNGMTKVNFPMYLKGTVYHPNGIISVVRNQDLLISDTTSDDYVWPKVTTFKTGTITVPAT